MRPLLLLTNDDGIAAPGLAALAEAMATLGRVVVVAPDREQSASSHSLTLHHPLRLVSLGGDRYHVDGTPTDCVHLAIPRLTDGELPQLVVSGINAGVNLGDDVIYSGTVAGAMEGTLLHVPSIAVSAQNDADGTPSAATYRRAAELAARVAAEVLERGLPDGVLLNLNVPRQAHSAVRVTRQGTRSYRATSLEREDPAGRPYYWIDLADTTPHSEPDADHEAIAAGDASVTPLHVNLTHRPTMAALSRWSFGRA